MVKMFDKIIIIKNKWLITKEKCIFKYLKKSRKKIFYNSYYTKLISKFVLIVGTHEISVFM